MKFTAVWANGAVVELEADGFFVTVAEGRGATVRAQQRLLHSARLTLSGEPPPPSRHAYFASVDFEAQAPDGERMRCVVYVEKGAPDSAIIAGASLAMSREYPRHALHIASEAPGWLKPTPSDPYAP